MILRAAFAGLRARLTATAGQATASASPLTGRASYTPATYARTLPRDVGEPQLPALRLALLCEARKARDMRQAKLAALIEADLRAVTHQILSKGR